jgi:hypothetical protein
MYRLGSCLLDQRLQGRPTCTFFENMHLRHANSITADPLSATCLPTSSMFTHKYNIDKDTADLARPLLARPIPIQLVTLPFFSNLSYPRPAYNIHRHGGRSCPHDTGPQSRIRAQRPEVIRARSAEIQHHADSAWPLLSCQQAGVGRSRRFYRPRRKDPYPGVPAGEKGRRDRSCWHSPGTSHKHLHQCGLILIPIQGRGRRTQLPLHRRSLHWHTTAARQAKLRHWISRHMGVEHPTARRCQRWQTFRLRPNKKFHLERTRRQHLENHVRRREYRQRHRRPG